MRGFDVRAIGLSISAAVKDLALKAEVAVGFFLRNFFATDQASITDDQSLGVTKPLSEAPSLVDDDVITLLKRASELGALTDDNTLDFTKFAGADLASFADNNLFSISKFLNDQTFVTDDLDGEASTEDDQEIAFVKTRTDIGAASDTFHRAAGYLRAFTENGATTDSQVKLTTKVSSDSAAFTDAGNLRSQGYCDFTYFAEDYVGASRTFT